MKTLAYQIELATCCKTFTFDAFQRISDEQLRQWRAQEKLDGRRYTLQVRPQKAKHNYVTSRRTSETTGLLVEKQDSMPYFRDCAFGPRDSVYDGEMRSPDGGTSHEAATAIAEDTAVFNIFDVLRLGGRDVRHLPQIERWQLLRDLGDIWPDRVEVLPVSQRPRQLLAAVRALDGEGIILKDPAAEYGKGWVKVVAEEFFDVVVVGYTQSTSDRYGSQGWIRSVRFAQWRPLTPDLSDVYIHAATKAAGTKQVWCLYELGQTSGFTEAMRAEISKNPSKYMNTVMVLRAKGREASGAFRHPRFHSWHPDKNPNECRWIP